MLKNYTIMNRIELFNFIEEQLNILVTSVIERGKLNLLDIHVHSESFYKFFLNEIYGWKLKMQILIVKMLKRMI